MHHSSPWPLLFFVSVDELTAKGQNVEPILWLQEHIIGRLKSFERHVGKDNDFSSTSTQYHGYRTGTNVAIQDASDNDVIMRTTASLDQSWLPFALLSTEQQVTNAIF